MIDNLILQTWLNAARAAAAAKDGKKSALEEIEALVQRENPTLLDLRSQAEKDLRAANRAEKDARQTLDEHIVDLATDGEGRLKENMVGRTLHDHIEIKRDFDFDADPKYAGRIIDFLVAQNAIQAEDVLELVFGKLKAGDLERMLEANRWPREESASADVFKVFRTAKPYKDNVSKWYETEEGEGTDE